MSNELSRKWMAPFKNFCDNMVDYGDPRLDIPHAVSLVHSLLTILGNTNIKKTIAPEYQECIFVKSLALLVPCVDACEEAEWLFQNSRQGSDLEVLMTSMDASNLYKDDYKAKAVAKDADIEEFKVDTSKNVFLHCMVKAIEHVFQISEVAKRDKTVQSEVMAYMVQQCVKFALKGSLAIGGKMLKSWTQVRLAVQIAGYKSLEVHMKPQDLRAVLADAVNGEASKADDGPAEEDNSSILKTADAKQALYLVHKFMQKNSVDKNMPVKMQPSFCTEMIFAYWEKNKELIKKTEGKSVSINDVMKLLSESLFQVFPEKWVQTVRALAEHVHEHCEIMSEYQHLFKDSEELQHVIQIRPAYAVAALTEMFAPGGPLNTVTINMTDVKTISGISLI